ncbi:MAG: MBOAT family protein [Bacteroidetes bacterium]|nr:MBOAT family protein [Bacteroidota bacterium]
MNWPGWSAQKLLIPIGISFYTFKTVGYCIDVYKRKYAPASSFLTYALSVSFFPQLIAGPIEKSKVISEQLNAFPSFNWQCIIDGSKLILWGLFKKLVIADSIAQIINPMYGHIQMANGLDFVVLCFSFMYQIYTDFSGYSDIAIGSALCFGVSLPANFNKPFFSRNYRELWNRWHTTFSRWLKEYIFDPLGGVVKNNKLRTVFNLWMVFIVVGIWHGATLNYMIYAQLAFLFMLLDIITKDFRRGLFSAMHINRNGWVQGVINYIAVMSMFSFLVVFFRPVSFKDSVYMLQHVWSPHFKYLDGIKLVYIFFFIGLFEVLQVLQKTADGHCFQRICLFHWRALVYLFIFFSIILFSSRSEVAFQYFQF